MALSKELQELLGFIKDPKAREKTREALEAQPDLQTGMADLHREMNEGRLRQSDYDRKMDESKVAVEAAEAKTKEWSDWADKNVPIHKNLMEEHTKLQEKNKTLEQQVKDAAGKVGDDVNLDELYSNVEKRLEGKNYVSKAELATLVTAEANKLAAEKEKIIVEQTLPAAMEYVARLNDFGYEYRDEFKDKFDRKAFSKFVVDGQYQDVDKAYAAFVADKRNAALVAKTVSDTEARVRAEMTSATGVPGSGVVPGAGELGPLSIHLQKKGPTGIPENARPGDGSLAAAAAADLRAEGKV